MAVFKCKMCGGDIEVSEDKTFGTCEACGSVMTFPKISDEQRADAFNRGNHFRRIGEFDKALQVYERIVNDEPTDAEAHWCCALCRFGIEYVEDPVTFEYLPTCHRASFDIFTEDVDYLAALENSDGVTKKQYQKEAAKITEVQRGILSTSQKEEPFDVFICYKESDDDGNRTVDSTLAQDIYYQLTDAGLRVFFSRITLEDKVGSEYEPYIFAALNSAKAMICVGTCPEHFNAVWVKNEWSRYLSIVRHDHSKVILPCYKDMDPYDLPEQLSILQSYDMSKIGFVQDLIRGIKKVTSTKPVETKPVETSSSNASSTTIENYLKRVEIFLGDSNWTDANTYCEKVLDLSPENATAYLYKLFCDVKVKDIESLGDASKPIQLFSNFKKAKKYGDEEINRKLDEAAQKIEERNERLRQQQIEQRKLEDAIRTRKKELAEVQKKIDAIDKKNDELKLKDNSYVIQIENIKKLLANRDTVLEKTKIKLIIYIVFLVIFYSIFPIIFLIEEVILQHEGMPSELSTILITLLAISCIYLLFATSNLFKNLAKLDPDLFAGYYGTEYTFDSILTLYLWSVVKIAKFLIGKWGKKTVDKYNANIAELDNKREGIATELGIYSEEKNKLQVEYDKINLELQNLNNSGNA